MLIGTVDPPGCDDESRVVRPGDCSAVPPVDIVPLEVPPGPMISITVEVWPFRPVIVRVLVSKSCAGLDVELDTSCALDWQFTRSKNSPAATARSMKRSIVRKKAMNRKDE